MTNKEEQEVVRSVFRAYINDLKAHSTKTDRPTFKMLEEVKDKAIQALAQEDVLEKVRVEIETEINNCSSMWVGHEFIGHTDQYIENVLHNVLSQAKERMLNIIDKYKAESEDAE